MPTAQLSSDSLTATDYPAPELQVSAATEAPNDNASPAPINIRARAARGTKKPERRSNRLAAKEPEHFVHASDKASQLRALKDELQACSKQLQDQVKKRDILKKTRQPLTTADLRKLTISAGLGVKASTSLNKVLRAAP